MIDCSFCHSNNKQSYLFTQCSHLICIDCAAAKWDQKYSIRCCDKTTYLDDDTCTALLSVNVQQNYQFQTEAKQNIYPVVQFNKTSQKPSFVVKNQQKSFIQPKQLQESVLVRQFQPITQLIDENQKRKEQNLIQMEKILSDEIARVKYTFEMYRKQLQKRQQIMLKEIYNKYSDHLSNITTTCSDQDVDELKQKLNKLTPLEPNLSQRQANKQDKILQKLDYNQQIMRQKLNRHYNLLK